MNPDSLSEDWRNWPQDPYQLLGVAPGTEPEDARRAYMRLIRRFKPERFPEQFRRIREAYEAVKQNSRFQAFFQPASGAETGQDTRSPDQAPRQFDLDHPSPDLIISPAGEPDIAQHWDGACKGKVGEAYRALCERAYRNGPSGEVPLRLYWLLTAHPELDPDHSPCEWLVRGLREQNSIGPYWELYRREVDGNPKEALTQRYCELLDTAPSARALADYLAWRWAAVGRLRRPDILAADLDRFRPRFTREDEESWVDLLFQAANWAAWFYDRSLFRRLRSEIDGHHDLHTRMGELFSRLDLLTEVSKGWRTLDTESIKSLLPQSWCAPWSDLHAPVLACAKDLVDDPSHGLEVLDQLQANAPTVLAHFGETLERFYSPPPELRGADALKTVIADFVKTINPEEYAYARPAVFEFCLSDYIHPHLVAAAIEHQYQSVTSVSASLREDWSLLFLYFAYCLIWG